MEKQEYINMLDEFITFDLAKKIIEKEGFDDVDGDIGIDRVMQIALMEEKIVDLLLKGFKENKENSMF